MAFLKIVQGKSKGDIVELIGERTVIGRHPGCEVVLDSAAVSRHHAQILESHGRYYLEDLRSRNRTSLNSEQIEGRSQLNDGDSIQVCEVLFHFHQKPLDDDPASHSGDAAVAKNRDADEYPDTLPEGFPTFSFDDELDDLDDASSIITTLNTHSNTKLRLGVQPEVKLRAVLDIGRSLASVLDLDQVFHKTLESMFDIFPQADTGFALLRSPGEKKVVLKATKSRGNRADSTVKVSSTIVRQAMEMGNAILSADAVEDKRFKTSESVSDLQIKSMMCVPLIEKGGDALGVMQLDSHDMRRPFSQDDLDLFVSVALQVSLAVENAQLHEKLLQQRDMERDLEFATQIQLGFLPNQRPSFDGYELSDFYESAMRVGGDYFDYVPLPNGRVAIALGDVAGKGIPAALLMARLFSSARYHFLTQPTVAKALSGLNDEIASSGLGFRFITYVAAIFDPSSHEITIANAGHLPPLVRRNNGEVEIISKRESGMPLGIAPQKDFHETTIVLEPGETLTLFTDGITESMNAQNEIYGRERLRRFLSTAPINAEQIVSGIVSDVERFSDGRPQRDDMCLVCLVRHK